MKKFAAVLLLGVHLFYMGGYSLVLQYFIHKSDQQIVKQIYDNKINSARLTEIKIPVNLPGMTDWSDYEEIDGRIQYQGNYYHYVRLKMTRDTMSMLCVPNETEKRLTNAKLTIAKEINDVPLNKKGHESSAKKGGIGQDLTHYAVAQFVFIGAIIPVAPLHSTTVALLMNPYIESPGKPPNVSC